MKSVDLDDYEEAEAAVLQRDKLQRVRQFLVAQKADVDLIDAVDEAIWDIEQYIDDDLARLAESAGVGNA